MYRFCGPRRSPRDVSLENRDPSALFHFASIWREEDAEMARGRDETSEACRNAVARPSRLSQVIAKALEERNMKWSHAGLNRGPYGY